MSSYMTEDQERRYLIKIIKKRYKDDGENATVHAAVYKGRKLWLTHIRTMSEIDRNCMEARVIFHGTGIGAKLGADQMPLNHSSTDLLMDMYDALLSDRKKKHSRTVRT